MNNIKSICVYSSSCNDLDKEFFDDAKLMGELIAKNGYNLVYGGGCLGLMYANASAVKLNGGQVVGVLPEKIYNLGLATPNCDNLIVTDDMRTRKARMDKESDAVIALAGGFGTLEELSEMIVQKQLGYTTKPIVILNTNGFYDNLINFFNDIFEKKFANKDNKNCYYVASTPQEAIEYIKKYVPQYFDVYQKIKIKPKD